MFVGSAASIDSSGADVSGEALVAVVALVVEAAVVDVVSDAPVVVAVVAFVVAVVVDVAGGVPFPPQATKTPARREATRGEVARASG